MRIDLVTIFGVLVVGFIVLGIVFNMGSELLSGNHQGAGSLLLGLLMIGGFGAVAYFANKSGRLKRRRK
jgi:hypothetical protein